MNCKQPIAYFNGTNTYLRNDFVVKKIVSGAEVEHRIQYNQNFYLHVQHALNAAQNDLKQLPDTLRHARLQHLLEYFLDQKFSVDEYKQKLINTAECDLVNGVDSCSSFCDMVYGVCYCKRLFQKLMTKGDNILGVELMKLREKLIEGDRRKKASRRMSV